MGFTKKFAAVLTAGTMLTTGSAAILPKDILSDISLCASAADTVISGFCGEQGENVRWSLDSEGTLTITGEGNILDQGLKPSPWSGNNDIKKVVINDGITNIRTNAFKDCASMTSVTIPDSVQYIGNQAFYGCKSLTEINIPDSVTEIGSFAFYGCESAVSINIPIGLSILETGLFNGCSSLTSITIPQNLSSIAINSFAGCSKLEEINVNSRNLYFESYEGVLFNDGMSSLIRYPEGRKAESYTTPQATQYICKSAFEACNNLKSVTLSSGIRDIDDFAFTWSENLSSITFPKGDIAIGRQAFEGTAWLTEQISENPLVIVSKTVVDGKACTGDVVIPDGVEEIADYAFHLTPITSIKFPESILFMGEGAFFGCQNLTSVDLPYGLLDISDYLFCNCENLTSVTIPDTVASIGTGAFDYCGKLKAVTIPEYVSSIGNNAFSECISLAEVSLPENLTSIGEGAFHNCALKSVVIPDCIEKIEAYTFDMCDSLTDITIPDSVKEIGDEAFSGCTSLTEITLPESISYIGKGAFYGCTSLTGITLPKAVTRINDETFMCCESLASITIHDNITSIGQGAFAQCSALKEITFPHSVTEIGDSALWYCESLSSVTIKNPECSIDKDYTTICNNENAVTGLPDYNGVICGYDNSSAQWYAETYSREFVLLGEQPDMLYSGECGAQGDNVTWELSKNGVLTISGKGEMMDYTEENPSPWSTKNTVETIIIEDGVTSIGALAFYRCQNLTSVEIANTVTSIGEYAFAASPQLGTITIPTSVTDFGLCAFISTPWLMAKQNSNPLVIVNNVVIDGSKCTGDIIIPDGVTTIGTDAFSGSDEFTSVTIPTSVTTIRDYAFPWTLTVHNVRYKGSEENWKSISIGKENDALLEANMHYNYGADDEDIISTGMCGDKGGNVTWKLDSSGTVTISGNGAMQNWPFHDDRSPWKFNDDIKKVVVEHGVTTVGDGAFHACDGLLDVVFADSVEHIGEEAFDGCKSLRSVIINNKNCDIFDAETTIAETAVIYGHKDSTAQAYAEKYSREFKLIGNEPTDEVPTGDATGDGNTLLNDAVLILQHIGNSTDYPLSDTAKNAADVYQPGTGLTNMDALTIQKYILGLVRELPVK